MRKISVLFCVVATLFCFFGCQKNYTHGVYEVTITAAEIFNHSVGNDWQQTYTCNGKTITNGEQWTVPLNTTETVKIIATVTENDKWPDVGYGSLSVVLTDNFETSSTITVTENRGSHKGNKAEWEITCKVKLVEKLTHE